jgi:hypothetical protein
MPRAGRIDTIEAHLAHIALADLRIGAGAAIGAVQCGRDDGPLLVRNFGGPRIKNSAGGFEAMAGRTVLANSSGFVGDYSRSLCTINAAPITYDEKGRMQQDYW